MLGVEICAVLDGGITPVPATFPLATYLWSLETCREQLPSCIKTTNHCNYTLDESTLTLVYLILRNHKRACRIFRGSKAVEPNESFNQDKSKSCQD